MEEQCECKKEDNLDIEYIGVCQNEQCQEDLFCEKCKGLHADHEDDTLVGEEFNQFMEECCSPEYQKQLEKEQILNEFITYYDNIQKENIEEGKMLNDVQKYFKEQNFQEIVKNLDKIKKYKEDLDNNKAAEITKKLNEYKRLIKELDYKYFSEDNQAREEKLNYIQKGKELFHEQLYQESLENLEQALQIDNECVDAILLKSQTLIQLENFDFAITACDQIIKKNKLNIEAYFIKIIALLLSQKYDKAYEELKKANHNCSYNFYCNIINLIKQLENSSNKVKQTLSELNYDLKERLQSLILFQEMPAQMIKQYLTQLIQIIQLADQDEINHALFQYNLNFEIFEEDQIQYFVDLRPKLDNEAWKQMIKFLESLQEQQNINNQVEVPLNPNIPEQQNNEENQIQPQHINMYLQFLYQTVQEQQNQLIQEKVPTDKTSQSQELENNNQIQTSNDQINNQTPNQFKQDFNNFLTDPQTNEQQLQAKSQALANQLNNQTPNQVIEDLNNFLADPQTNEQQQQAKSQAPANQLNNQTPDQFKQDFANFLTDQNKNEIPSNQQQQQAESQAPNQPKNDQTPNQVAQDLDNFLNDTQPNNIPQNQQSIQSQQQQLSKETPIPIIQQQLADFYDQPQKQIIQPQQQVQKQTIIANEITPYSQQDLQNFMNELQPQDKNQESNKKIRILDEDKRFSQILKYCDEMIIKSKDKAQFYFKKAMTLIKLQDYDDAIYYLDQATTLQPEEANYYYQKALLFQILDQNSLALLNFDEAIQKDPAKALYYQEKGNALQKQNRQPEAEQYFELAKQKQNED